MDDKNAAELLWQEFESAKQALKDVLVERFLPLFPDLEQLFDMLPLEDIASLLLKRKEEGSLFSCWENMVRLVVGRTLFFVSH